MKKIILYILIFASSFTCHRSALGQDPVWDDVSLTHWPEEFIVVEIPSSADGKIQRAFFHKSSSGIKKPLIVTLHTWSGDYSQHDPLISEIIARDLNYIHPDFRGPNRTPESTVSPLVLSDIEDVINYALLHSDSDPEDVHIIGVSGGGLAALACFMNIPYPVASFSAWAPISDLENWYLESLGRKQKYSDDIMAALGDFSDWKDEAASRSPLKKNYPSGLRENSQLFIYTGIHDGYTGSVPITHSIDMFNHLVKEESAIRDLSSQGKPISDSLALKLVASRYLPHTVHGELNGRKIYVKEQFENFHLIIFEGSHEQLPHALSLVPFKNTKSDLGINIFTIGDSNGANSGGWVDRLRCAFPSASIYNDSQGGRTIGFDNNGKEELNALKNIETWMEKARNATAEDYDYIIFCLGTNDAKTEFDHLQNLVPGHFIQLLEKITLYPLNASGKKPKIIFVTPPPMGIDFIADKYIGGNDRLSELVPRLKYAASEYGISIVDIYHPLQQVFRNYAPDGVHMAPYGQEIVAQLIRDRILAMESIQ